MNYLICNHCQYKNAVYTQRLVFCQHCHKKIENNFADWKKANPHLSFETYVNTNTTTDATPIITTLVNEHTQRTTSYLNPFLFYKTHTSQKSRIFIGATLFQLVLFICIIFSQGTFINPDDMEVSSNEKNYLNQINWSNYSITQDINITLPFELKQTESVLPCYMHNYIDAEKSMKAESSESFSVTIVDLDVSQDYPIPHSDLMLIQDDYMKTAFATIKPDEDITHFKMKQYYTDMQRGSYILNGKHFYYDNYTLTKGTKTIKVIVSYLQDDDLLNKYANIVSQSLLNNKETT